MSSRASRHTTSELTFFFLDGSAGLAGAVMAAR